MGYTYNGTYSGDVHDTVTSRTAFDYSARAVSSGDYKIHPSLDPKGVTFRECRDSDGHPLSRGIVVLLDATGSNKEQAKIVHAGLPDLMGLIVRKGADFEPHIMVAAVNDIRAGDRVVFQMGQFEADNALDLSIGNLILFGGGGGGIQESYELALYGLARHTAMDCLEKRGQKGLLFIVGDEQAYPTIRRQDVKAVFGEDIEADIPTEQIVAELKQKFEVTFIIPLYSQHGQEERMQQYWANYFGQSVVVADNSEDIVPRIASEVLLAQDVDVDSIISDLRPTTSSKALVRIGEDLRRRGKTGLATVAGDLRVASARAAERL